MSTLATWLFWCLAALLAAVLVAAVLIPRIMGWVPLTILSGSMEPTYPIGSQVIVERVETDADFAALQVGDVISFLPKAGSGMMVTHRVIQSVHGQDGSRVLITQGDANTSPDPYRLTVTQVRGVVRYHVPYVGYAAQALSGNQKKTVAQLTAGGLFLVAGCHVVGALRARR
ncbi:MAG: signal peptidase I [Actinomycetia bacterium]|nr:signal peptidase I [Actinomycetes bacterium]